MLNDVKLRIRKVIKVDFGILVCDKIERKSYRKFKFVLKIDDVDVKFKIKRRFELKEVVLVLEDFNKGSYR